jgi:PAS domain S-box-containing protein
MTKPAPATDGWSSDSYGALGGAESPESICADLISILDTVDLPVVVVGRDFSITRFNRAAMAAVRLTPSDIGRSAREVQGLAGVNDIEKLCMQVIADGAPCRREIRDGDRCFILRIAPYTGSDRQIGGAVLTLTNVTALRASLDQAIYEREYTKAILNTVVEPLVVLDADLRVQTANRAFYVMFGVSREQTQSAPLQDLGNDDWRASRLWAALKATASGDDAFQTLEIERDFPAIGRRTVLADARRLSRDGAATILLAFQDITERKLAEEAVRASEERLRTLVTASSDVVYRLSSDWTEMRHLDGRELIADTDQPSGAWLDKYILPDDQPHVSAAIAEAIRTKSVFEMEHRVRRVDGSLGWTLSRAVPILDANGEIVEWFGAASDATRRKEAEEALRRSETKLREADHRKDEFLAMLAHELRNPLAPLRNMLEVMKRADGDGDLVRQARDTMERQLEQMVRLVDDLLDVSRITRNRLELRKERVELAPVIHDVVEMCRPLVLCVGHEIAVTVPPEPIHLHADPVRLVQVFGNLINNSCKYTAPGGRIWLTAERQGNDVVVKVKDTGVGISPDKLNSIFEMFAQVDRSLERSQGGLGIGLTLAKRLVEMHDGSLTAHSEGPDRGSEFVVRLPVLSEESKADPLPEPAAERHTMALRILVVDDNRESATSLALLLQMTGNDTQTAYDGLGAVEQAEAYRPDVILLDIGLPEMNGYDACREIRRQPWGKEVVVIALTGWGQDEDRRKSKDAGFNAHLVKPVDYAALLKLLAWSESVATISHPGPTTLDDASHPWHEP